MKSAAVDCRINFDENQDGTYVCALFGKAGGFLYNPELQADIEETAELYGEDNATGEVGALVPRGATGAPAVSGVASRMRALPLPLPSAAPGLVATEATAVPAPKTRKFIPAKIGEKTYYLEKGIDPASGKPAFIFYGDTSGTKALGKANIDPVTGGPQKGTAKLFK